MCERPRLDYAVRVRGPVAEAVHHTARAVWSRASLGKDWRDEVSALARSAKPVARAKRVLDRVRLQEPPAEPAQEDLKPVRAAFVVRDNFRQRRSIERSYVEAMRKARALDRHRQPVLLPRADLPARPARAPRSAACACGC